MDMDRVKEDEIKQEGLKAENGEEYKVKQDLEEARNGYVISYNFGICRA